MLKFQKIGIIQSLHGFLNHNFNQEDQFQMVNLVFFYGKKLVFFFSLTKKYGTVTFLNKYGGHAVSFHAQLQYLYP